MSTCAGPGAVAVGSGLPAVGAWLAAASSSLGGSLSGLLRLGPRPLLRWAACRKLLPPFGALPALCFQTRVLMRNVRDARRGLRRGAWCVVRGAWCRVRGAGCGVRGAGLGDLELKLKAWSRRLGICAAQGRQAIGCGPLCAARRRHHVSVRGQGAASGCGDFKGGLRQRSAGARDHPPARPACAAAEMWLRLDERRLQCLPPAPALVAAIQ